MAVAGSIVQLFMERIHFRLSKWLVPTIGIITGTLFFLALLLLLIFIYMYAVSRRTQVPVRNLVGTGSLRYRGAVQYFYRQFDAAVVW